MVELKQHKFRYLSLADEIRTKIRAGIYPVGQKLRTVSEMVTEYSVARSTVIQAMDMLAEEGLIVRGRGRGTFVADRSNRGEIAIVLKSELLATPFYALCVAMLMGGDVEHHVPWRTRLHLLRHHPRAGHPLEDSDLTDERVLRELRGVFTFHELYQFGEELNRRRIPVILLAQLSSSTAPLRIWSDLLLSYRQVMSHLKDVGCRTVGSIWDIPLDFMSVYGGVIDCFQAAAKEYGLRTETRWLVSSETLHPKTEQSGRELFHEFWKRPEPRPDALFVDDEYTCRGVLRAALELGVHFGTDIKLITRGTLGVDLPADLQVTRVDFSPAKLTSTAIAEMEKLLAGRLPEQPVIRLPLHLTRGQTT